MATAPQSNKGTDWVEPLPPAALVREQLARLLAHPLFTNSKRYPVLLAYVVEQALLGNSGDLKERTIGVEAFGREPNYDVNLDPVVRTTAAEVRKRLIQYYYSPDHAGELLIEMPVGSYVPSFREPPPQPAPVVDLPPALEFSEPAAQPLGTKPPVTKPPVTKPPVTIQELSTPQERSVVSNALRWTAIAASLILCLIAGFAFGRAKSPPSPANPGQPTNMARFWEPITATSSRITYCLGAPTDYVDLQMKSLPASVRGSLNVYDVVTLARSIVPLVPKNGEFRVLAGSSTGFAQLREGPSVMIGAFDNPWTMRITQDLPIGFEFDNHERKVVDRRASPQKSWALRIEAPYTKLARDYAVVGRIHDKVTGQPVIILAGILGDGTEAASEVVSNPAYLDALLQKAPKNWDQLNMEAVIEADVIEDHPGPPTVVAVETW